MAIQVHKSMGQRGQGQFWLKTSGKITAENGGKARRESWRRRRKNMWFDTREREKQARKPDTLIERCITVFHPRYDDWLKKAITIMGRLDVVAHSRRHPRSVIAWPMPCPTMANWWNPCEITLQKPVFYAKCHTKGIEPDMFHKVPYSAQTFLFLPPPPHTHTHTHTLHIEKDPKSLMAHRGISR